MSSTIQRKGTGGNRRPSSTCRIAIPLLVIIAISAQLSAEQAKRADDFVESIGIATHWDYASTIYTDQQDVLKQKIIDAGIRHVRGVSATIPQNRTFQDKALTDLFKSNVRQTFMVGTLWNLSVNTWTLDTSNIDQQLDLCASYGNAISAIEGPNECSAYRQVPMPNGELVTFDYIRAFMRKLYTRAHQRFPSLPVYSATAGGGDFPDLHDACDYENTHSYPWVYPECSTTPWGPSPQTCEMIDIYSSTLTGTVIGTTGSLNNNGNTRDKAVDNNMDTWFDAPAANGAWVGLDLGKPELISKIIYRHRKGFASRMVNGKFQGSNSADFSSGVTDLSVITSTPTEDYAYYTWSSYMYLDNTPGPFRYVRYLSPDGGYCNIAEMSFKAPLASPRPTVVTETGYLSYLKGFWAGSYVPEEVQAKYILRNYLRLFMQNVTRSFWYELADMDTDSTGGFGLIANNLREKPAYKALKNMIGLLSDKGPSFTPGSLGYSLSGSLTDVKSLLFQKRNGVYYLVVWQAKSSYDQVSRTNTPVADVSATLTFTTPVSSAKTYLPTTGAAAVATYNAPHAITLSVPDHPLVIECTLATTETRSPVRPQLNRGTGIFEIMSLDGRVVARQSLNDRNRMDVGSMASGAGIYFIRRHGQTDFYRQMIIVNK